MSDLPPGWEWTTLENLTDAARPICYGILMPKEHISDGVPYVRVKDFSQGSIDIAALRRTSPEIAVKYHRSSLVGDDVLISIRGTYGRVVIAPPTLNGANITQDTARIAIIGADHRYVARYLQSPNAARYFREVARGVAVKGVNIGDLKFTPVPVPPRGEQERIVAAIEEHLSRLNAAESALSSARRRLATFRSATTSETLRGGWPMVRLGDHTIDQRYGSSSKAGREGAVPVLRMGNIVDGRLDYADLKYLPDGHPDLETCTLEPGDLLFNRTNSPELVGKSAVFEGWATPITFASYLIRVRLDDELDAHWVSTAINGPAGRQYIDTVRTQQVGQANVNGTKLKDFPVPMPSIDVQRERLAQLDLARTWFRAVESEIHRALMRASALRRSILAAAFSGKLVPQDSDDEPASMLLGRIRDQRALAIPSRRARARAVAP